VRRQATSPSQTESHDGSRQSFAYTEAEKDEICRYLPDNSEVIYRNSLVQEPLFADHLFLNETFGVHQNLEWIGEGYISGHFRNIVSLLGCGNPGELNTWYRLLGSLTKAQRDVQSLPNKEYSFCEGVRDPRKTNDQLNEQLAFKIAEAKFRITCLELEPRMRNVHLQSRHLYQALVLYIWSRCGMPLTTSYNGKEASGKLITFLTAVISPVYAHAKENRPSPDKLDYFVKKVREGKLLWSPGLGPQAMVK
jgi:hypothetical protein